MSNCTFSIVVHIPRFQYELSLSMVSYHAVLNRAHHSDIFSVSVWQMVIDELLLETIHIITVNCLRVPLTDPSLVRIHPLTDDWNNGSSSLVESVRNLLYQTLHAKDSRDRCYKNEREANRLVGNLVPQSEPRPCLRFYHVNRRRQP